MKKWIRSSIAIVALFVGLVMSAAAPAAPAPKNPQPAAGAVPAPEHPEIREAIAALRRARDHMQQAAHDFGGHRVDALRATDEAIRQLQDCLKYDR